MSSESGKIVLCLCGESKLVSDADRAQLCDAVRRSGRPYEIVTDLCGLIEARDSRLARWAKEAATIVACYERGVRALFAWAQALLPPETKIVNARTLGAAGAAAELGLATIDPSATELMRTPKNPDADPWMPWFPVIDRTRCSSCRQCLSFCLFGVYAMEGDRVQVVQPRKCKTYCPACARVCPQMAIIFPKHDQSPINGDEVRPEHLEKKVDLHAIGKGDLRAALANRHVSPAELQARARELAERAENSPAAKPKDAP